MRAAYERSVEILPVFDDVLTEVYGYARSRRVIWAGFAGALNLAIWKMNQ